MDCNEKLNIAEIVKNEIKNNLKLKVTAAYGGYVVVELLYKDEVIDSDWMVDLEHSPYESELPIGF